MRLTLIQILKLTLCSCLICVIFFQKNVQAQELNLFSDKAISIIADSGEVIYEKNSTMKDYPASTTKVMTAILMMEYLKDNQTITMSKRSLQEEKSNSQILFSEGEKLDRNTALKAMMILSANDLAYAIGETVAGDMNSFVKMMNDKAKEIGAKDTHFVTPNGLHDPNHYTTAYDLALIAKEALKYPLIIKAMGTKSAYITTSMQNHKYIFNRSKMFKNPYFIAGKTGYTNESRNTLIEIDRKDGQTIINILLRSSKPQYLTDIKMLDSYAFPRIRTKILSKKSDWKKEISVDDYKIQTKLSKDISFLTTTNSNNFQILVKPIPILEEKFKKNGIPKNQKIGKVEVWENDLRIMDVDLLSAKTYEKPKLIPLSTMIIVGSIMFLFLFNLMIRPRKKQREFL